MMCGDLARVGGAEQQASSVCNRGRYDVEMECGSEMVSSWTRHSMDICGDEDGVQITGEHSWCSEK